MKQIIFKICPLLILLFFTCDKDLDFDYNYKITAFVEDEESFIGDEIIIDFTLLGSRDINYRTKWSSESRGDFYYNNQKIQKGQEFKIIPGNFKGKFIPLENGNNVLTFNTKAHGKEKQTKVKFNVTKFNFSLEIPEIIDVVAGETASLKLLYSSKTDKYNAKLEYSITDEEGDLIDIYTKKTLPNPYNLNAEEKIELDFVYPDDIKTYIIIWEYKNDLGDKSIYKTKVRVKGFDYSLNIPDKLEINAGDDLEFDISYISKTDKYNPNLTYSLSSEDCSLVNVLTDSDLETPLKLSDNNKLKLKFNYPNKGVYTISWEYKNDLEKPTLYKTKIIVKAFNYSLDIDDKKIVKAGQLADFKIKYSSDTEKYNPTLKYTITGNQGEIINSITSLKLDNPYNLKQDETINLEFKYPNKKGEYLIVWEYKNSLGDNIIYKTIIVVEDFDYSFDVKDEIIVNAGEKVEFDVIYKSSTNKYNPKFTYSLSSSNSELLNTYTSQPLINPYNLKQDETINLEFKYPNKEGEYLIIWEYQNDFSGKSVFKTKVIVKGFKYSFVAPKEITVNAGDKAEFDIVYKSSTNKYNAKFKHSFSSEDGKLINTFNSAELNNPYNLKKDEKISLEFKYPNKEGEYYIFWEYQNDFGEPVSYKTKIKVKSFNYSLVIPSEVDVFAGDDASFKVIHSSDGSIFKPTLKYIVGDEQGQIYNMTTNSVLDSPIDLSVKDELNLVYKYPRKSGKYIIQWEYDNGFGNVDYYETIINVLDIPFKLQYKSSKECLAGDLTAFSLKVITSEPSKQKYKIKSIRKLNLNQKPKLMKEYNKTSYNRWNEGTFLPSSNSINGFFLGDGVGKNRGVEISIEDEYGNIEKVTHLYTYTMNYDFRSELSKKAGKRCAIIKKWYNHKRILFLKNLNKTTINSVEIDGKVYDINLLPDQEKVVSYKISECSVCGIYEDCPLEYMFDIRFKIDGVWSDLSYEDVQ